MSALVYFPALGKWVWCPPLFIFQWQVAAICQYVHLFIFYWWYDFSCLFSSGKWEPWQLFMFSPVCFAVASGNSDSLPIVSSSRSSSAPSSGRRSKMQFHFDSPHRNQCRLQPDRCVVLWQFITPSLSYTLVTMKLNVETDEIRYWKRLVWYWYNYCKTPLKFNGKKFLFQISLMVSVK